MQGANTITRVYGHARRLSEILTAEGVTAEQAENESDLFWKLAASAARVTEPDEQVKARTVGILRDAETAPDPFAAFAGVGF